MPCFTPCEGVKMGKLQFQKITCIHKLIKLLLPHSTHNAELALANTSSLHCPRIGRLFFFIVFKSTVTKPTSSLVQEPVRSTLFHAVTKVPTAFWHLRQCNYSEWETKPRGFTCNSFVQRGLFNAYASSNVLKGSLSTFT